MIARNFVKELENYEVTLIRSNLGLIEPEKQELIPVMLVRLPLEQKQGFLGSLHDPQNKRKKNELINKLMKLETSRITDDII